MLIDPASVHRERLPNGLTVLVRRDASAPVVAINTYVKAGYFDETDDVVGIAHVLEHMYFKGTPTRGVGEIAKQTKASGGYLNAHTIYDHTSYYTVLPASGLASGLEIQADAYARSLIDADELRKELEVIIQEAKRKQDNPGAVTTETLYALLHDRHRIRRWRIGREEGLRRLTQDDLLRFYRNFYRPSETVLAIVGDVAVDDALARVHALYGTLPDGTPERSPGPQEDAPPGRRWSELSGDVRQTHLAFGWRTPGTEHPDTPRLDLVAGVLATGRGSRLYRAVRERSLAQGVSAYDTTPTELGVFVVHLEGPPDRAVDAARATWAELRAVHDDGVTEAEVERVQRIADARALRRMETMEGQAGWLAEWEAHGAWEEGIAYHEALVGARASEVSDAARRWLDLAQCAAVAYRPADAPPLAADGADFWTRLDAVSPAAPPVDATPSPAPVLRSGHPRREREEAGVVVFRTDAGIPILVRRKPGSRIAHMGVTMLGGAAAESDAEAGLASLVAQTSVKGTTTRTAAQIADEAERLGGSVGASAGHESIGWGISVPVQRADLAAALLADVVQRPVFPDEAFETERRLALAELATVKDDMYRYPMRLALRAAWPAHPYGRSVVGTEESLPTLDAARARAWHRARVLTAPAVLAFVGDVDPEDAAAMLAREFDALAPGDVPALPPPQWPARAVGDAETRDKAQTALALLFPGPSRRDPERVAAQLLAGIASGLGGRFFDELRDRRSLAYTVQAFTMQRSLAGAFGAYIATSPGQEAEARDGLLAEFDALRAAPPSDEELTRAQTYALGTHAIHLQSGGALLGDMVDAWLFGEGLHELDAYEERVRAVTPRDVQALAERWFDPEVRAEGVVRGVAD